MTVPHARYLLCRPHGGLNDTLVQLELCRRHAARFARTMIVDLSRSGLRLPFDDVFVAGPDFGAPVFGLTPDLARAFDDCTSVRPSHIAGRISSYVAAWNARADRTTERQSGAPVSFDFNRDHPETLIVHEEAGGGTRGFGFLRHVALAPALADAIARRLIPLGQDYDSIHVRHTDLSTDYVALFENCRRLFAGRRVLVCSDSAEVKAHAGKVFDGGSVLSAADIPDTSGLPLHQTEWTNPEKTTVDLLCDLFAIARGRTFVFTAVKSRDGRRPGFSGFSVLADMLRQQPAVARGLLARADPALLPVLFETPHPQRRTGGIRYMLARLDQWRWNFPARRLSTRLGLKLRCGTLFSR